MTATALLGRYAAHADPATAAANLVALVLAGNGPFYPLYVLALLARLNAISVATLTGFLSLTLANVLRRRPAEA